MKKVTDQSFIEELKDNKKIKSGTIYGFVILTNDEEELETLRKQIKDQLDKEEEEKKFEGEKEQRRKKKKREKKKKED